MTKVIILAAGEGSRLHPYTKDCPKCLVKVNNNQCLLDYQLNAINAVGDVDEVILVTGYLKEKLAGLGYKTYVNERYAQTNMVWTLFCAEQELNNADDIIVAYGDIAYSKNTLERLCGSPHDISVVVDRQWESYWRARFEDPLADAETLRIDSQNGHIIELGQKPEQISQIEAQYIGLMKFSKNGLQALKQVFSKATENHAILNNNPPENAYMTDMLQALIDQGYAVHPLFIDGGWVEVDSTSDLKLDLTVERLNQIAAE